MLESLTVRNIALIDLLTVSFGTGLHVLTGETGAGKSIIVDALTLLLGGRASKDLIRSGCDKAYVEGAFSIADCPRAIQYLTENQLDAQDGMLILSREITQSGRSSCRADGVLLPLAEYKQLTALLMDIHGQHEHQSLMDEKQHLRLLDALGDKKHRALIENTAARYLALHTAQNELSELERDLRDQRERVDLLRYQQQELQNARLVAGEEDALERERDLNKNAEKIENRLRSAYQGLYDGGNSTSALDSLRVASNALNDLAPLDMEFKALAERTQNLYYDVEDVGLTLRDKLDSLHFDEDRMDEIMSRLDLIRRLSRKYGATVSDMLNKLAQINASLDNIENADEKLDAL